MPPVGRTLAWLGIALLTAYLVFFGGTTSGTNRADVRVITIGAAAAVLMVWAAVAWRRQDWRPRSVLAPAILAALGSLAVSTLFSRFPRVSAEYLAFAILLAALYLLLVRVLADPFLRPRMIVLVRVLFVVVSAGFVVLCVARWTYWWGVLGRLAVPPLRPEFESLTFGNPSAVLTMTALFAVPTLASLPLATGRGRALAIGVVALLGAVAILSGSRAGWLAIAFAGLVILVVLLISRETRTSVLSAFAWWVRSLPGRVIVLAGGLVVAVLAIVLAPPVLRRIAEGGEQLRTTFVAVALRMFGEAPLTGTGPGSWVIQRIRYTEPTEVDYYIPHAHNIYAQTLGELGVVGAVAGLILIAFLTWLIRDGARDAEPSRRRWAWAAALGLLYFGAHQAFDLYANMPAALFAAAIPIAYLDATASAGPRSVRAAARPLQRGPARTVFAGGVAVAVGIAAAGLLLQEIPALQADRAVARANVGDWAGANADARAAAEADPEISSYLFTAGLTAAHGNDHGKAAAYFRAVAERDDLPEAWLNLAAEEIADRSPSGEAVQHIEAALRLGDQRPAIAMAAGDLALRLGQDDVAFDAFGAAITITPSLVADPWWAEDPARAAMLERAVAAALDSGSSAQRWEIALMTGDSALARTLATDPATLDFIDAWTGDQDARARLISRCGAEPLNIPLLLFCARAEGRAGNVPQANDFRYLANAQVGGAYSTGAELRVKTSPSVGRSQEGGLAIFWGTYTYRRPTPWDMLVPRLVHLGIE
jgi:O-antigen ligase